MTVMPTERRLPLLGRIRRPRLWMRWAFLVAFTLVGLESTLIAIAWKREMLVLLAPGIICLARAWEMWKQIQAERERE